MSVECPHDPLAAADGRPPRVIFFGASSLGRAAALAIGDKAEIIAFVDNDPRKWGGVCAGRPIHPPASLVREHAGVPVLVASAYHAEIGLQLRAMQVAYEVFVPPAVTAAEPPDFIARINTVRTDYGETLRLVQALGHRPATVVDVGVAFGTPELYDAFPDAALVLIEPVAEFLPYMERIVAARPGSSLRVAAAGAAEGDAEISVTADRTGTTFSARGGAEKRRVPVVRVDEVCRRVAATAPYVVKVDVQGHELPVVEGCEGILGDTLAVVLEVSFIGGNGVPEVAEVVASMKRRGFVAYDILGGHNRPLDFARMQADVVFVREDGPLRADRRWATEGQVAEFLTAKQRRANYREVMSHREA